MKILSVGGSIIIPKTGFDITFLKKFRAMILREVKKGGRFILVVGGGATARVYQDALGKVVRASNQDLDWVGIGATIINAEFVRLMFGDHAHKDVIRNPEVKVRTQKPIIVAAGNEPGHSTDTDAVLMAKTYGAKHLLNLSNIKYVYDKDPGKHSNAKKIERIDWETFRKEIVGSKWTPGFNAPFDPIASKLAQEMGLAVGILDGTNLAEVGKAIAGKPFQGTTIG